MENHTKKFLFFSIAFALPLISNGSSIIKDEQKLRSKIVQTAREFKGLRYNFGGNNIANGLDCSSFVKKIYSFYDISLPRVAKDQYKIGVSIPRDQLKPGDLVFFQTYRPGPSHVGIYSDKNLNFIHAGSSRGVTESLLTSKYFKPRYLGAKRIIGKYDGPKIKEPSFLTKIINSFKDQVSEIAQFQEKQPYLKPQLNRITKIKNFISENNKALSQVCPEVYSDVINAYVYDTFYKTIIKPKKLSFGERVHIFGGSKPLEGKKGLITKACVILGDNSIEMIDSRSMSLFPPESIVDKNCKQSKPISKKLEVLNEKTKLRFWDLDYENVFGKLVQSHRLDIKSLNKGTILNATGIVEKGPRKGDFCITDGGITSLIYEGDVKVTN